MKTALVTGSTGFIGSHLIKALVRDGWEVSFLSRPKSSLKLLSDVLREISAYEVDGSIDSVFEAMRKSKPDVVFHIASMVSGDHSREDISPLIESNITFGVQLLEAMTHHKILRLVNTSTYWEHYEDEEYNPVNLYAATKRAFQDLMQYYIKTKGIRAITLKLFDTYGENDPRPKLLNLLFRIAETGETLVMSPGDQKIDLVHIDDVVSAYLIAAEHLLNDKVKEHDIYGVKSGQSLSLKELVTLVEKKTGKKLNIKWGGKSYREREIMEPCQFLNKLPDWQVLHKSIKL